MITFDVVEHFTRQELIPSVDEVRRLLRPVDRWIIHIPNAESLFGVRMRYGDLTHEMAFTRTSFGQLLVSRGFETVSCFEDHPVPHGMKRTVCTIFQRVIRAGELAYIAI